MLVNLPFRTLFSAASLPRKAWWRGLSLGWALCLLSGGSACGCAEDDPAAVSRRWSTEPPAGLQPSEVPLFVSINFDDNFVSGYAVAPGGMRWATDFFKHLKNPPGDNGDTFDGTPARTTFFCTSTYVEKRYSHSPVFNKFAWHVALSHGHELANHTHTHPDGSKFDKNQWRQEIAPASNWLQKPYDGHESVNAPNSKSGLGVAEVLGFRAPYLFSNSALFEVLDEQGIHYDSSIESCWGDDESLGQCAWPYTLDWGSPDSAVLVDKFEGVPIGRHPHIWELPVAALLVPSDDLADELDFEPGLRARVQATDLASKYEPTTGKIAAVDIVLFVEAEMTGNEALATLKYSLDRHLAGNRAPMTLVTHTHVYAGNYEPLRTTYRERQEVIEKFIEYALSKPEVRLRPSRDVVQWLENPHAL